MDKTFEDLEWGRLVAAVRQRCAAPRPEARPVPLATTIEGARTALAETSEALRLAESGEPIPLEGIRDVRASLTRVAREGSLEGPGLRDVESTLRAALFLRGFLGKRREKLPALFLACPIDPTLDRLADEIASAIDPDGTVADRASPELRKLRTEVHNLRARLVSRLEEMIQKNAAILSDRFYTIRDGRYVLPLRTDTHESFPGIVHGTSGSGATLFVEPRALINQGNRLKVAEAEMIREEARILGLLSERVRERVAEVTAALDAVEHADLRNAMARLGRDLSGVVLTIDDAPRVRLLAAKHPLLLLDGVDVVPSDIVLAEGHGMIVSGPNAGGKTVSLKVLGLAALMVRAGIPFPADEGSSIGFFDPVLTDVGDEQSIEKNLSTFSAHVSNVARILDRTQRGSMILLDELAGGTDPAEGAALACAVVEAIVARGGLLAATTHYEQLKAFASTEPHLTNASVGFDVERLMPTFELHADVPGASSALFVASRFGISDEIIARARAVLPEQARGFEEVVAELGAAKAAYEAKVEGLAAERRELDEARALVARRKEALSRRDSERVSAAAKALETELRSARDEIAIAKKTLRRSSLDAAALEQARARIEAVTEGVEHARVRAAEAGPDTRSDGAKVAEGELRVGDRVYVPRLKTEAEILDAPRRGQVKIAAGAIRLTVSVADLRVSWPREAPRVNRSAVDEPIAAPERARVEPGALRTTDNTVDVRGLRVDEALGMIESFVDRLYGASASHAFIIHGHGTGALRDAIRAHLGRDESYVSAIRAGDREEGGDGITVVTLR